MNKKGLFFPLICAFILSACANTATIPIADNLRQTDTRYAIASVESANNMTVGYSPGLGGYFGVIGVLIESSSSFSPRETLRQKLADATSGWRAEDVIRDVFDKELQERRHLSINTKEITKLPEEIVNKVSGNDDNGRISTLWYNPDKTTFDHHILMDTLHPNIILEVGYQGYDLQHRDNIGWIVNITTLVKAIDPQTGAVIGRSRNFIIGGRNDQGIIGEFDLSKEKEVPNFINTFKSVFEQEVTKLVRMSCDELNL